MKKTQMEQIRNIIHCLTSTANCKPAANNTKFNSTYRPAVPQRRSVHLYQMPEHQRPFEMWVQTFCPRSSNDGTLASLYCTQSPFLWCNLTQSAMRSTVKKKLPQNDISKAHFKITVVKIISYSVTIESSSNF